jgi:hypothetical protein
LLLSVRFRPLALIQEKDEKRSLMGSLIGLPRTEVFSLIMVALVALAFVVAAVVAWRRDHPAAWRRQESVPDEDGGGHPVFSESAQWSMERR